MSGEKFESETIGKVQGEEFEQTIEGNLQTIKGWYDWRVKQLSFVSDNGDEFGEGVEDGKERNCPLAEGEKVSSVLFTWEKELRTMTFKTSAGNSCEFGTKTGSHQKEVVIPEGRQLAGIRGTFYVKYISSVTLLYQ